MVIKRLQIFIFLKLSRKKHFLLSTTACQNKIETENSRVRRKATILLKTILLEENVIFLVESDNKYLSFLINVSIMILMIWKRAEIYLWPQNFSKCLKNYSTCETEISLSPANRRYMELSKFRPHASILHCPKQMREKYWGLYFFTIKMLYSDKINKK